MKKTMGIYINGNLSEKRGYHSVQAWKQRLKEWSADQERGVSTRFISGLPDSNEIIAICSLTNIVRGPFQACNMGYAVSQKYEGEGFMKALCKRAIEYAFKELYLNRIMANYMLSNYRSALLRKSLGFTKEGESKNYLKINGAWEDHVLTSLLNPENT